MPFDLMLRVLLPSALGAVSLAFLGLGLYALLRKRPFVLHARWMLSVVIVAMSPSVLIQLSLLFSGGRHSGGGLTLMLLLGPLTMVIVTYFLALQMRGYLVFGTTQDSFRTALLAALSNLGLEPEETLSSLRLPSVPAELHVAVQGWIGTGQLHLRNGGRPG